MLKLFCPRFQGGWHILEGGLAGCEGVGFDLEGEALDIFLQDTGLDPAAGISNEHPENNVLALETGAECDGFQHYIVPPALYQQLAGGPEKVKKGEYRYWNWASWRGDISVYESVWEWVAINVEELERRAKEGDIENDSGGEVEDEVYL